ncbi:MAG TPA: hydroxyacid dehydrogenase [Thermodesulfobacteriota bacterium]|nr:hydroxyacid dehydrogenase [Thermodesulfobacteriota bacterium]
MADKRKVLISSSSTHPDQLKILSDAGAEVKIIPDRVDEVFRSEIRKADGMIIGLPLLPGKIMAECPKLMIVARNGVGYDNVDVAAAAELGIVVTNTPGVNSDAVAEFTFGLLLSLVRRIPESWEELRRGGWRKPDHLQGVDLRGRTMSIIGLGQIGSRVSRIGNAFGLKILACDPYIPQQAFRDAGAEPVSKEEAIRRADFLTLHTPLNEETRNLVGAPELAMMKPGAIVINTSRGGVVDEEALMAAAEKGSIGGAALDVFQQEPIADRRIACHPKIMVTGHLAGMTRDAMYRMFTGAAIQVAYAFRGEKPPYAVNEPKNPRYLKL